MRIMYIRIRAAFLISLSAGHRILTGDTGSDTCGSQEILQPSVHRKRRNAYTDSRYSQPVFGSLMGRLRRHIVGAGHNNHKAIVRIAEQQQ